MVVDEVEENRFCWSSQSTLFIPSSRTTSSMQRQLPCRYEPSEPILEKEPLVVPKAGPPRSSSISLYVHRSIVPLSVGQAAFAPRQQRP